MSLAEDIVIPNQSSQKLLKKTKPEITIRLCDYSEFTQDGKKTKPRYVFVFGLMFCGCCCNVFPMFTCPLRRAH